MNSATPLIVTGHGLGGSIASLLTISLLDGMRSVKNRPLCITYGSPLIGDEKLQQAISRSPIWNSCFLHVVLIEDPLPRLFITNHSSSAAALSPKTSTYMPFGTYLLCSDANSTCFDNPDSILELLKALGSIYVQNQGIQFTEYENIAENLTHKAICKDLTTVDENESLPKSDSVLASSIRLQLRALGLTPHMQKQQKDIVINNLEISMKRLEKESIVQRKFKFNPSVRLSQMRASMAQLEWYKMDAKNRGIGYYDSYKNMNLTVDSDADEFHKKLRLYWENMVEEADTKSEKGGAAFRKSWLYAGTSYRRMVEPLTIADYYRDGRKDYVTNRPKHFVLLEEWFRNETTKDQPRNTEAILRIQDSYNWEYIGKALLSRQHSMVSIDMEDYWDILSYEENEEPDAPMYPSFWARVDDLLSTEELNLVEDNEKKKSIDEDYPCFEAHVDEAVLSPKGSMIVKENVNRFGASVDEALLSRQQSMLFRENVKRNRKINVELILTTDSCFWAHVEEALLACRELEFAQEKPEILMQLIEFEDYVYGLLQNYEVSSDIFLKESSFMSWWNKYKAIKGSSYNSELTSFMNDPSKRVQYSLGAYDFTDSPELQ